MAAAESHLERGGVRLVDFLFPVVYRGSVAPRTPSEQRPVPALPSSKRDELRWAAAVWRRCGPEAVSEPPPWVLVKRLDAERDDEPTAAVFADGAVIAAVFAVHLIAPSKHARPEPWLIRAVLRATKRGPVILARVAVEHLTKGDAEVTGMVLRGVPLARIRDLAQARLGMAAYVVQMIADEPGWHVTPEEVEWARRAAREAAKLPLRRGRKGYPPDHYRGVALRAIELANAERRDVIEALREEEAKRLGKYVAYDTIKRQVERARKDFGFLAPTTRGRANFQPGPNLYRKEKEEQDG